MSEVAVAIYVITSVPIDKFPKSEPRLSLNQRSLAMEVDQIEAAEVERTTYNVELAIRELADLELAMVGGGHGDVIL